VLLANPKIIGGNFRLIFDGDTPFSRWLTEFYAWIRSVGLYYCDSGIFVRRSVYEDLGGFRPISVMEDLEFVSRLERFGWTCCIKDPPLITSSRRFERRHPLKIGRSSTAGRSFMRCSGSAYLPTASLKSTRPMRRYPRSKRHRLAWKLFVKASGGGSLRTNQPSQSARRSNAGSYPRRAAKSGPSPPRL
jgi:hypothetical protein